MARSRQELLELVDAFEQRTLPRERWTHAAHLVVGLVYVLRYGGAIALERLREAIPAYNAATGRTDEERNGYREDATSAWVEAIDDYVRAHRTNDLPGLFCGLRLNLLRSKRDRDMPGCDRTKNEPKLPVVVIGGGIGGLSCAVAMRRTGLPIRVFEGKSRLAEVGSGIGLWTGAVRALQRLGIGSDLWERSVPIRRAEVASWRGARLTSVEVGDIADSYGAPSFVVHRADLLAAIAAEVEPGAVTTGAPCIGFDDRGDHVEVHFNDRPPVQASLLIGADGLHSVVRRQLWGAQRPRYSGETCYRGVADLEIGDPFTLREVQGPGRRCAVCVIAPTRVYWWATCLAREGQRDEPARRRQNLLRKFGGWPFGIAEAMARTDPAAILRHDLYDREPLPRWSKGRVTLLGDAAHPTTSNLGQGAGMAIEDAVALARAWRRCDLPSEALPTYEHERLERTSHVVRTSLLLGKLGQWRNPVATRLRELAFRLTPTSLLERMFRQQIGYDAGTVS